MQSKTVVPKKFYSLKFSFTKRTIKPKNPFMVFFDVSSQRSNVYGTKLTFFALVLEVRMICFVMVNNSL